MERALKAGWAEDEIANALLSLAELYAMDLEDGAVITTRVLQ